MEKGHTRQDIHGRTYHRENDAFVPLPESYIIKHGWYSAPHPTPHAAPTIPLGNVPIRPHIQWSSSAVAPRRQPSHSLSIRCKSQWCSSTTSFYLPCSSPAQLVSVRGNLYWYSDNTSSEYLEFFQSHGIDYEVHACCIILVRA